MSRLIDADALLKELESSKLQPTKDTDGFTDGWYDSGYADGYNACIDELLGGEHGK